MNRLSDRFVKFYLFLVLLLLPVDWFAPTGNLMREFGAKPAIPLLALGSFVIFLRNPFQAIRFGKATFRVAWLFAAVFALGCMGFFLNLVFSWSGFGREKNPIVQFAAQGVIFLAFALCVLLHASFFRKGKWRSFCLSVLPAVICVHLAVFFLEASGLVSHTHGWLSLFRIEGGSEFDRPSGLMSEPSYFGTFAALYGFPLIFASTWGNKSLRWALAITLFGAAIFIRAKTFIPVLVAESVIVIWQHGKTALKFRYIALIAGMVVASAIFIVANATFDLRENLSSVDRIGSTILALNVAKAGYGLIGIGFGQFHFFYRPEFAPNFIFLSEEAQAQMTGSIGSRASTYNLYARFLVETGITGLLLFVAACWAAFRKLKHNFRKNTQFALFLAAGSLGFLLTQDTYFYPPLAFALALLLAIEDENAIATHSVLSENIQKKVIQ